MKKTEEIFCKKYYFIVDDLYANFQEAERKKAERERERVIRQPETRIQPMLLNFHPLSLAKTIPLLALHPTIL
ncbi:MAG: hypothetical protein MRECE_11c023 [Mycoplasmataceae bacterium CE_OT135]|nr:MAG: hypothetical protein MRECE_11c023 [Mycoplasmataceae bacterium CE_OT135]